MARRRIWRPSAYRLLRGAVLVEVLTAACFRMQLGPASTVLLYLISVVIQSLDCNFFEAAAISVLATANLDYFFTAPIFSFAVSGPLEGITLSCLLIVSLVITRIQARSRGEALESRRQRAEMQGLYKVSQELLALSGPSVTGPALLLPFLSAFDVAAVCLFDGLTLESYEAGNSAHGLDTKTRDAFISGHDAEYAELGIVTRRLLTAERVYGAIGFEGLRNPEVTAPALASLAAGALERARAFRSATTAAAHAEAETLRSAILDALAHEFKTPLTTILTAAGGLRVGEPTRPEQAELAEMIETEASRLGDLTTRLLRLARVDREELEPRRVRTEALELATRTVRRYQKLWPDRELLVEDHSDLADIYVDQELIGLAVSQLVENACRYSHPGTSVTVELDRWDDTVLLSVWNAGRAIPEQERERIFERFYRGLEFRRSAPGSGLGLYVARKIARAHGGDLSLADGRQGKVGFRMSLPIPGEEPNGERGV